MKSLASEVSHKDVKSKKPRKNNKETGVFHIDELDPEDSDKINSTFAKLQEFVQIVLCTLNQSDKHQLIALSYNYIVSFERTDSDILSVKYFTHILDIPCITITENEITIDAGEEQFRLVSKQAKEFAQILYQNISLIHFVTNNHLKPEVKITSPKLINEYKPKVSPSQIFQINYSSYQKYTTQKYQHSLVQTMHQTLSSNYPLFDISRLPLEAIDSLTASLSAIMSYDNINGFICTDTPFSNALRALSNTLLIAKENLRVVHLTNIAAASSNLEDFINNFMENIPENLTYIDLSESVLDSLDKFAEKLAKTKLFLTHIGLSHCNITADGCESFFKNLSENPHMKKIKVLKIGSFEFNSQSIKYLSKFLTQINSLETIDLSGIDKHLDEIIYLLSNSNQPLKHLWLRHTNISGKVYENLLNLLEKSKSLFELDLGSAHISDNNLANIIKTFGTKCTGNLKIGLSELVLDETQSMAIVRGFLETGFEKWSEIDLDNCMMDQSVIKVITALFGRMKNLETVSLSNFKCDVLSFAVGLLQQPSIKRLIMKASLDDLSEEFYTALLKTNVEFVDLSLNCLPNDSLSKILNIYRQNHNLRSIKINGNIINDTILLEQFVDEAINREICTECLFGGSADFGTLDHNEIHSLYLKMSTAVDYHRAKQGLLMELPNGVAINNLRELTERSVSILKGVELHKHLFIPHTFIPLPFQNYSDIPTDDNNDEEDLIISENYPEKSSQEIALGKSDIKTIVLNKPPFVPICPKPILINEPEEDISDEDDIDSGFILESLKKPFNNNKKAFSDSYSEDSDILNTKPTDDFFADVESYNSPNTGEVAELVSPRSSPLVPPQQLPAFVGAQLSDLPSSEENEMDVLDTVDSILKSQFVDLSSMDVPPPLEYSESSDEDIYASKSSLASDISLKRSRVPMKANSTLRTETRGMPSEAAEKSPQRSPPVRKKKAMTPRAPKLEGTSLLARRKPSPNVSPKRSVFQSPGLKRKAKAKGETPTKTTAAKAKTPSRIPRKLFQASKTPTKRKPSTEK